MLVPPLPPPPRQDLGQDFGQDPSKKVLVVPVVENKRLE